ncbi:hypothetical protein PAMP_020031 [Pampus punctatissimus]
MFLETKLGESETLCIIQHCLTYTIAEDEWICTECRIVGFTTVGLVSWHLSQKELRFCTPLIPLLGEQVNVKEREQGNLKEVEEEEKRDREKKSKRTLLLGTSWKLWTYSISDLRVDNLSKEGRALTVTNNYFWQPLDSQTYCPGSGQLSYGSIELGQLRLEIHIKLQN